MEVTTSLIAGAVVAAVGALISLIAGALTSRFFDRKDRAEAIEMTSLETKLLALSSASKLAIVLADEIRAEIDDEAKRAADVLAQAEHAATLASMSEEQASAIRTVVQSAVEGDNKRSRKVQNITSALYFVGGAAVSLAITLFVNPG